MCEDDFESSGLCGGTLESADVCEDSDVYVHVCAGRWCVRDFCDVSLGSGPRGRDAFFWGLLPSVGDMYSVN